MEIIQVTEDIFTFKAPPCGICDFRFGCYTSQSSCCPLHAVRVMREEVGDNHLFMKCFGTRVEINKNLGKFDESLLARIADRLVEEYAIQQKSQKRN